MRSLTLFLSLATKELDRMESMGVIAKVDEATPWCAGMVVFPKKIIQSEYVLIFRLSTRVFYVNYTLYQKSMSCSPRYKELEYLASWMPTVAFGRFRWQSSHSCLLLSSPHMAGIASKNYRLEFLVGQSISKRNGRSVVSHR